jgi:hypothetical protein
MTTAREPPACAAAGVRAQEVGVALIFPTALAPGRIQGHLGFLPYFHDHLVVVNRSWEDAVNIFSIIPDPFRRSWCRRNRYSA